MAKHLYRGDCPDVLQPSSRDQECEACREEDELRKDAERYRWLRDRMAVEDMPEEHPAWSTPSEHESAAFDSAVDARMKGANAKVRGPEAASSPEAPSRLTGYAGEDK